MRSRIILKTTVSLKQLQLQWENFKRFKWQQPVFCIGMWSLLWKTLNSVQTATVAQKSSELGRLKMRTTKKAENQHKIKNSIVFHKFSTWPISYMMTFCMQQMMDSTTARNMAIGISWIAVLYRRIKISKSSTFYLIMFLN